MKLLLPVFFAMTGIAFAQSGASQGGSADGTALAEKIIETYKQIFVQAKPIFDAADVQLPKELLGAAKDATPSAESQTEKPRKREGLQTGSLQTGGLPLTLPNVDPTTEPIEQYQMWRKAERDKALRDRYLELRKIARGD